MPTYGYLHGDKVIVNMTEANFESVEAGIRHVMKVTVRNISMRGQRIRLIPPKPKEFTLHVQNDVELAPGLEMQAELAYFAESPVDVESQLLVLVGRADINASIGEGEKLTIPVRATLPGAKLVFDTVVDYGTVLPSHSKSHTLVVRNEGSVEGKISIQGPQGVTSKLTVLPLEALVQPGESAEFKCDLKTDHELGPFSVPLSVTLRGQMAFFPQPPEVTFQALVADPVLEIHDGEGKPMSKAELGRVFCGLAKASRATLVNTGPLPVNFAVSKVTEDGQEGEGDKETPEPLTIYPPMGRVEPHSSIPLEFTFAPPKKPPPPKGFVAGEETEEPTEEMSSNVAFEVLETGQKVPLRLEGTALAPRLALSSRAFNFGACSMYEHREVTLKLTNKQDNAYNFAFVTPAHYAVTPSSGVVGGGASLEVQISFKPHQVGTLTGVLQLLGFGGKVASQPIQVVGHCTEPAHRKPAGGTDQLPEDFYSAPIPVDQGTVSFPPSAVGAKWQRPPKWEMSETLQGGKVQQGGNDAMVPLTTLTKKKTYAKQMAYQPVLDAIEQMDTGLELPAAAIKAQADHRAYYNEYLKTQHAKRASKRKSKHVIGMDPDDFLFGVDLGLDAYSGCMPFLPPPSTKPQKLQLEHEYDDSFENKAGLSSALFDPFRTGGKKFKSKPETMDEAAECKATLKPEELTMVTGGPRTLDFGNISVFTQVTRCFTVINELRQSILVALDCADEPELTQPPPQVVPPGGAAGFDLTFSSKHPNPFRRTITYTVNGSHAFKFTAAANVEPIDVGLSQDEAVFRFADGSLDPTISQTVMLHNPGTFPAKFKWEHPAETRNAKIPPPFVPSSMTGEVPPKKMLPVEITYTPVIGAPSQHVLTAIVEGGPAKTLHCVADVDECRAICNAKKVDFGVIPAGIVLEKTVVIKNPGSSEAVFTLSEPSNAAFTCKPKQGVVRAGGSAEVSIEVLAVPPPGQTVVEVTSQLLIAIRCGKPIKLPLRAEARIPDMKVVEDEISFGGVVAGATTWRPLTLTNRSVVPATLHLDLSGHPDVLIGLMAVDEAAEAAAAAAMDDRATTVIPDDEGEEPALQLLSQPAGSPPPTGAGSEYNAGDEQSGRIGGGYRPPPSAEEQKRIYQILVKPEESLELKLGFCPRGASTLELELPLIGVGLPSNPALRRVVVGDGLKPRLELSPVITQMGNCILRAAQFPYTTTATVTNMDTEPLTWRIDMAQAPKGSTFSLSPSSGALQPGETATIEVAFAATKAGLVDVAVPLYIDGGSKPYLTPHFIANAVPPRLTFDRPELILPTVPLGHTSTASLYVINEGYDNLLIEPKLPIDVQKAPLSLDFPEGQLVGVSKERILISVSFTAKKPTSLTAFIELLDTEGNRFALPVTMTTDNSVVTAQPYLDSMAMADPSAAQIICKEGKPPTLVPPQPPPPLPTNLTAKERRVMASAAAQKFFLPPQRTDEANQAVAASTLRGSSIALAYISSALMTLPALQKEEGGSSSSGANGAFPAMFVQNKQQAAYDLINLVSGKSVPLPDPPADRKNEKAALRYRVLCLDGVLAFLRAHGAMLAHVKPEVLLALDDYTKLVGPNASRKERSQIRRQHRVLHPEAWLELLFQLLKCFVLGRVTTRAFKQVPGLDTAANDIVKEINAPGASSLLYSTSELLVLRWLEHHCGAAPHTPFGGGNPLAGTMLTKFDKQLRDGHVFARVLLSHCPFLATLDEANPPTNSAGEQEFGTAIDNLYPRPCSAAHSAANLGLVLGALHQIGLRFSSAAGMPELVPSELHDASSRELLLFALYLYQHLPHYTAKATVAFSGGLHEPLSRSIELSNPAKKPIVYEVRLEGAPCFRVADTTVRLDGKSTRAFGVECNAVFTGAHKGKLIFLSRGDGVTTAHASTLVFDLSAHVDVGPPMDVFTTSSKLYQPSQMTVTVSNPFDVPASFRLTFNEYKPALDGAKGGGGDGGAKSLKGAASGVQAIAKAAKLAGVSMASMIGGAGNPDDPMRKIPGSFFSPTSTLAIEGKGQVQLSVQFLPFQMGDYSATILFADENVGEFSYELRGSSSLPPPLELLSFASESASSASKEITLPFRNPMVEKAKALVLERSTKEKERWSQIWGKEPLTKGPVALTLVYGSANFSGPTAMELIDNERRGGRKSAGGTAAGSVIGSVAGSGVNTPRTGGRDTATGGGGAPQTANADANKLQLRFVPGEPGTYTSEMLIKSPLDIRLYDLSGACAAPGINATLDFTTPARMPLRQEVPVVNNSDADWSVSASLRGEGFYGPTSIKVAARTTGTYPLDFAPDWICEREGELILNNTATGDKYVYTLKGVGEAPLAEGNVAADCLARVATSLAFGVFNMSEKGEACELTVESDLLHVTGPNTISVAARPKGVAAGAPGYVPPHTEYSLNASPQLGGDIHGTITFTSPDGRYMWYTVELHAQQPPCEKELTISAPLRKVVAVEIPISNPAEAELEFTVVITGEGLLGDDSVRVEGKGSTSYELLFSPLVAGTTRGQVAFVNPQAGEFWYELTLTGEPTEPVELPLLRCAVGDHVTHDITISNPVGEELPLQLTIDNGRNYKLEGPKSQGGSLLLPPYGEITAVLTFSPSALDEPQVGEISLTHPKLGEWTYIARGIGNVPAGDLTPTTLSAPLGHTTSGTTSFRNPFDTPLSLTLSLDQPMTASSGEAAAPMLQAFELLARRTSGVIVGPGQTVQFPFSFVAREMGEVHAALVLHADYKGRPLTWRFPILGEAVSRPLSKPINLQVAARQPLTRELHLPLPGLSDAARDEPFTYELDLDAQSAPLIEGSLTLAPLQRTLAGGTLVMAVDWRPLRPVRTSAALVVRKQSGGRWRYDLVLEAGEPQPDDIIYIEAPINKMAQVQFKLCNAFDEDAPFQAFFSSESASVFTVAPSNGILTRAGTAGTLFTVSYTPVEYGKPVRGTLIVLTGEMQWSYEVRGMHPQYVAPTGGSGTRVDHILDPSISQRLGRMPKTNFLKKNMGGLS